MSTSELTCAICGYDAPVDQYRHGLTGEIGIMPDGCYVCVCPECGSISEITRKDGNVERKQLDLVDVLMQKHCDTILQQSFPIAMQFMRENPDHPYVKYVSELADKLRFKPRDN